MNKYEEIEQGIATNDVKKLRNALANLILFDKGFSTGSVEEQIQYIESQGIKLKDDEMVGEPPISSLKDTFTNDDFSEALFELKYNFCDERLADVKKIGRSLYAKKPESEKKKVDSSQRTATSRPKSRSSAGGKNPNEDSCQEKFPLWVPAAIIAMIAIIVKLLK